MPTFMVVPRGLWAKALDRNSRPPPRAIPAILRPKVPNDAWLGIADPGSRCGRVRIDKSRIVRLLLEFLDFRRFSEWHHAIARVRSDFRHYHGASPHLLRPQTFSEKVQWRKLFDLNPQFGVFSDKLRVRDFIRERAGPGVLPPLLWAGDDPDAVPLETLMPPYVLKSTHASG